MARRRQHTRAVTPTLQQSIELIIGPAGTCRHVPEVGRSPCAGGPAALAGFTPDGEPCTSRFASPDEREATYEAERDSLVVDRCVRGAYAGSRPWAWWAYEAGEACRCDPACERPGDREQFAWLDRHGVLSASERALARRQQEATERESDE